MSLICQLTSEDIKQHYLPSYLEYGDWPLLPVTAVVWASRCDARRRLSLNTSLTFQHAHTTHTFASLALAKLTRSNAGVSVHAGVSSLAWPFPWPADFIALGTVTDFLPKRRVRLTSSVHFESLSPATRERRNRMRLIGLDGPFRKAKLFLGLAMQTTRSLPWTYIYIYI